MTVAPWTVNRPWKGKACNIYLEAEGAYASLRRHDAERGIWPAFSVFDGLHGNCPDADTNIHTEERFGHIVHPSVRYMAEGVKDGLEDRRTHLPGRHIITKAIGLAVHLGASTIVLHNTGYVSARALRNLQTMVRPLKGARVRVIEPEGITKLFPTE